MKTINLLPNWYLQQQREKRSLRVRLALLVLLGAVMSSWTFVGQAHVRTLAAQRDRLASRADPARNLSIEIEQQEATIRRLENLRLAFRDVGVSVPMSAVLQQILNDLNPGMAISRVQIDVRNEAVKAARGEPVAEGEPRFHSVARMTVVGVAPNDVLIAQLIGKLSANPLFNDLTLNYTRTEMLRDYSVRRFEIQMTMDLSRMATEAPPLEQASAGGEHHAG